MKVNEYNKDNEKKRVKNSPEIDGEMRNDVIMKMKQENKLCEIKLKIKLEVQEYSYERICDYVYEAKKRKEKNSCLLFLETRIF